MIPGELLDAQSSSTAAGSPITRGESGNAVAKRKKFAADWRNFLKGAVVGAATRAACAETAPAQPVPPRPHAFLPPMSAIAETKPPRSTEVLSSEEPPGADFMVDVFKTLGFDYLSANLGTSFRGLHESFAGTTGEWVSCSREETRGNLSRTPSPRCAPAIGLLAEAR